MDAATKTITIGTFIRNNRKKITDAIFSLHPDLVDCVKSMNDGERSIMVQNEPTLVTWAKSQGVVMA
jgi:hypothetical protein